MLWLIKLFQISSGDWLLLCYVARNSPIGSPAFIHIKRDMGYGTRSTRIKLQDVDALTFYNDAQTSYRRTSPVEQLTCNGKPCSVYTPEVIQCRNTGGKSNDIQWKCEADLPSSIQLGRVEVSCEGYDHADDDYVLKGSCGLTYTLLSRKTAFDNGHYARDPFDRKSSFKQMGSRFASKFINNLFNAVTLCLVLYLLWVTVFAPLLRYFRRNTPATTGSRNSGNGAPPRPPWGGSWPGGYDHRPGFGGGGSSSAWRGAFPQDQDTFADNATKQQQTGEAWRPGFLSGLAAGATGEYLRSRMRSAGTTTTPSGNTGRSWTSTRSARAESTMQDRGEGTSAMGSIRTSTGYGGTRNR